MQLRRTGRASEVVEVGQPDRCPNGHQLRGAELVGWLPCNCADPTPGSGHRTFTCKECLGVAYVPEHDRNELPPPR